MKKEIKGFILGCVVTAAVGSGVAIASNATNIEVYSDNVSIYANGNLVNSSNFTYNDTTYVPLRAVLELMDCNISYDDNTKSVHAYNNYGDVTTVAPAYLNGSFTPYTMIFDSTQERFFVDVDILIDGDFSSSLTTNNAGVTGLMFMDNDKYVAINPTTPAPATPSPTPKPSASSGIQIPNFVFDASDNAEDQSKAAYESELNAINAKYDAMIEAVRSSYSGTASSMSTTIMAQQIQQYEQQRQNEIDQLNAKYGY